MHYRLTFSTNKDATEIISSIAKVLETVLSTNVTTTSYLEAPIETPIKTTAPSLPEVTIKNVLHDVDTFAVAHPDYIELTADVFGTWDIRRADGIQMSVSKRTFICWCNLILRYLPDHSTISECFQMLVANGISKQKLLTLLDWPDYCLKDMEKACAYPYMTQAWNQYFGPNNPYSVEYISTEVERKCANAKAFKKFAASTPPQDPEKLAEKRITKKQTIKEKLAEIEASTEVDAFAKVICKMNSLELHETPSNTLCEEVRKFTQNGLKEANITSLIEAIDWLTLRGMRMTKLSRIVGFPRETMISNIKHGSGKFTYKRQLEEFLGIADTSENAVKRVDNSYRYLFAPAPIDKKDKLHIIRERKQAISQVLKDKEFESSKEFFQCLQENGISLHYLCEWYNLSYRILRECWKDGSDIPKNQLEKLNCIKDLHIKIRVSDYANNPQFVPRNMKRAKRQL